MGNCEKVDISTIIKGSRSCSGTEELYKSIESLKVGEAIKWTYDNRSEAAKNRDNARRYLKRINALDKYVYHQIGKTLAIGRVK